MYTYEVKKHRKKSLIDKSAFDHVDKPEMSLDATAWQDQIFLIHVRQNGHDGVFGTV